MAELRQIMASDGSVHCRTVRQLISLARATAGRAWQPRPRPSRTEVAVLAVLGATPGGSAVQREILAALGGTRKHHGASMASTLNMLFDRRWVRFLLDDVVELTDAGRAAAGKDR